MDGIAADDGPQVASESRIKSIDQASVHRICAGQVITSLAIALKELVENALDAKATTIDVRLRDYGAESIEVVDNGSGISPADWNGLTARHCTSKISEFEDVYRVTSFGFRGEALSSLCEIAGGFTVTTRHVDSSVGSRIEYDRAGRLVKTSPIARAVGTTITVTDLFKPLPVRHREFLRALKRHYARAVTCLQAYALISTSARLLVSNTITGSTLGAGAGVGGRVSTGSADTSTHGKGRNIKAAWSAEPAGAGAVSDEEGDAVPSSRGRHGVLSTSASGSMKGTMAEVWGAKFAEGMMAVGADFQVPNQIAAGACGARGAPTSSSSLPSPRILGYVSKPGSGIGRSSADRQFFFLNGRPVELPRCAKLLNEVWRSYEMGHKPAACLDVRLPPGCYDVNVTPDKREVFLDAGTEAALGEAMKACLTGAWEAGARTFALAPMLKLQALEESVACSASQVGGVGAEGTGQDAAFMPAPQHSPAPFSTPSRMSDLLSQGGDVPASPNALASALGLPRRARKGAGGAQRTVPLPIPHGSSSECDNDAVDLTATDDPVPPARVTLSPSSGLNGTVAGTSKRRVTVAQPAADPALASRLSTQVPASRKRGREAPVLDTRKSISDPDENLDDDDDEEEEEEEETGMEAAVRRRAVIENKNIADEPIAGSRTARGKSSVKVYDLVTLPVPTESVVTSVTRTALMAKRRRIIDNSDDDTDVEVPVSVSVPVSFAQVARVHTLVHSEVQQDDVAAVHASEGTDPPGASCTCAYEHHEHGNTQDECMDQDEEDEEGGPPLHDSLGVIARRYDLARGGVMIDVPRDKEFLVSAQSETFHMGAAEALYNARRTGCIGLCVQEHADARAKRLFDELSEVDYGRGPGRRLIGMVSGARSRTSDESSGGGRGETGPGLAQTDSDEAALPIPASDAVSSAISTSTTAAIEADLTRRVLHKGSFTAMARRVVGQFNNGFLVAGLGQDLFILDQHACDEKSQFEKLVAGTALHEQQLLAPRPIELTAGEELAVLSALPTFAANGFHFKHSISSPAGSRLALTAVPFSKGVTFGDEDVRELASLVMDGDGEGVSKDRLKLRLPKIRTMLASRACRSAIMIGTALKRDVQRRVVGGMSGLDAPWSCPHGRPTLRHLVDTGAVCGGEGGRGGMRLTPAGPQLHEDSGDGNGVGEGHAGLA